MREGFKSLLVLGLTFAFVVASIYCCCIPNADAASAGKEMAECHQSIPEEDTSAEPQPSDCGCPHMLSLSVEKSVQVFEMAKLDFGFVPDILPYYISFVPEFAAYQSPPAVDSETIPLYLKHSNLRL